MLRAPGRRAALVVAFVGLLALLVPSTAARAAVAPLPTSSVTGATVALGDLAPSLLSAPAAALVGAARQGAPQVARITPLERPGTGAVGGWAVATLLLLLAALALLAGVRRSSWHLPAAACRAAAPSRAPPAHAC